ncbi:MAG TPA: wax ester/triacylglycerol synthase family O-acyltransferase [Vicinamibacterales bacterium]
MKPLSGLDALFLHLETPETPMHVGALHLLAPPPGDARAYVASMRRHVAGRLHLSPVFTRRLVLMPLALANPVWIHADTVDLRAHVRHVKLPAPGTFAQLEAMVARLHARLLERDRPFWRLYVIEGLASGELALYTKIHHATLDGAASVAFAHALLDTTPKPRAVPAHKRMAQGERPGLAELLETAARTTGAQALRALKQLPELARVLTVLVARSAATPAGAVRKSSFRFAPRSPLNVTIGRARAVATLSVPLSAIARVADRHQVTVNDVVLAVVSGALRRHLTAQGGLPAESMIAAVPVSLREAGNTDATTLATMSRMGLATDVEDALVRLHAIHSGSARAKSLTRELRSIIPTDLPSIGMPWLFGAAAAVYGRVRLADRIPPLANLVVSNFPGPAVPLYLAGARLRTWWPLSIVEHGLGLNVTVQSYAGSMEFGVVAAHSVMRDPDAFVGAMREAFAELQTLRAQAGSPK